MALRGSFLQGIKARFRSRKARSAALVNFFYWLLALIYLEVLLHATVYGGFDGRFAFMLGFSVVHAGVLSLITSFLPKKAQFPANLILTVALIFVYGSQMVYTFIFGTMYSVALIQQGGAAVTSFWRETLAAMWENLPFILLLLLPAVALIALRAASKKVFAPSNGLWRLILVSVSVIAYAVTLSCLQIGGTGFFSNHYYYYNNSVVMNQTAERFGLLTAFRLELTADEDAPSDDDLVIDVPEIPVVTVPPVTHPPVVTVPGETVPTETVTEPTEPPIEYNILDIDFDELNGMTEKDKIEKLNNYCAQLTGTNKNEYTGLLHDYNLIVLCAESFSTAAIHPEITPTLYRLANEGIIFNNYYNTFPNTTTDGEYALCMGLYPDASRGKSDSSMYASRKSYLPFVLGNIFSEQAGIQAYGYHNYVGSYYGRDETHPNMGYSMKFMNAGMKFSSSWPASDLEMMEQSIDDYIGQDQFHAYYMTFSGHYRYDTETNIIAKRNWKTVKNLDYSDTAKAYLSCHVELDKALEYLMKRLEEEGIADKTAIVLAGDHFPYGLNNKQYSELIGYKIDSFSKYKSTLIFWVGGLEENIVVDEYCCNVDILPTILNLWGFQYDSRMLAGTDVFSDGNHMAVLVDKSFLTDKVWFNANSGEVRYLVDESLIPEGYVDSLIKLVSTKFTVSTNILNTAYYNFVFEKGNVTITKDSWKSQTNTDDDTEADDGAGTDAPNPGEGTGTLNPNPGEGTGTQNPNPGEGTGAQNPNPSGGTGTENPNPGEDAGTADPAPDAGAEPPATEGNQNPPNPGGAEA